MNKEALGNLRRTGLLQVKYVGDEAVLPVTINGETQDTDVRLHHVFPGGEALYLPTDTRTTDSVIHGEVFETYGEGQY